MNILISAWSGTRNTGDNAIIIGEIKTIREYFPESKISVFTQNIDNRIINRLKLRKIDNRLLRIFSISKEIKNNDVFILGGGGLIQDRTSFMTIFHHLYKVMLAKHYNKTIVCYGLGVEKIHFWFNRLLTRIALRNVDLICVRDKESRDELINLDKKFYSTVKVTGDCSLNLPFKKNKIKYRKNKKIGICLRDWYIYSRFLTVNISMKLNRIFRNSKNKRFIDEIVALAKELSDEYEVHLIPFEGKRDEEVIKKLIKRIGKKINIISHKWEPYPEDTFRLISDMDIIIGMRFHSLVFGAIAGKKLISLNYSGKNRNFMNKLGLKKNQFDPYTKRVHIINKVKEESIKKDINYNKVLNQMTISAEDNAKLFKSLIDIKFNKNGKSS